MAPFPSLSGQGSAQTTRWCPAYQERDNRKAKGRDRAGPSSKVVDVAFSIPKEREATSFGRCFGATETLTKR